MSSKGTIVIGEPYIVEKEGKCFLVSQLNISGRSNDVWFSFDREYGEYLCTERSDAFLIGCLPYAQRHGLDIVCEAPVTAMLASQISDFLIPVLSTYDDEMYPSSVRCDTDDSSIRIGNEVGTSASLGVDSMHAIMRFTNHPCSEFRITKLFLTDVGAYHFNRKCREGDIAAASEFSDKFGYSLIVSGSNIHRVLKGRYIYICTYPLLASIYAAQKLFKTYIFPGSSTVPELNVVGNRRVNAGYQELFVLDMLSHRDLRFIPDGLHNSRTSKVSELSKFEPSHNFLHFCGHVRPLNCGKCEKCKRTKKCMKEAGVLDVYRNIFKNA